VQTCALPISLRNITCVCYASPVTSRTVQSTPPRRTQAARREATRSALLNAAAECLAEEGYARTTVRRIAERAGVTVGALQHHFSTRAALLGEGRRHVGPKIAAELPEEP